MLWFALGLSMTTGIVFGLVPALQASKQDLQTVLKQDGAGSGRRTGGWLRGVLVGAQVAVCMVLLISAGLLMRALYAAQTVEPGFEYRNVAVVSFDLRGPGYEAPEGARVPVAVDGADRRRFPVSIPSRRSSRTPLSPGRTHDVSPSRSGGVARNRHERGLAGYFSLIAIPIVRGRTFTAGGTERRFTSRDRHGSDGAPVLARDRIRSARRS